LACRPLSPCDVFFSSFNSPLCDVFFSLPFKPPLLVTTVDRFPEDHATRCFMPGLVASARARDRFLLQTLKTFTYVNAFSAKRMRSTSAAARLVRAVLLKAFAKAPRHTHNTHTHTHTQPPSVRKATRSLLLSLKRARASSRDERTHVGLSQRPWTRSRSFLSLERPPLDPLPRAPPRPTQSPPPLYHGGRAEMGRAAGHLQLQRQWRRSRRRFLCPSC
jgi:hypothetical protein